MASAIIKGFVSKAELNTIETDKGSFYSLKATICDETFKSKTSSIAFFNVEFFTADKKLADGYCAVLKKGARVFVSVDIVPDCYEKNGQKLNTFHYRINEIPRVYNDNVREALYKEYESASVAIVEGGQQ